MYTVENANPVTALPGRFSSGGIPIQNFDSRGIDGTWGQKTSEVWNPSMVSSAMKFLADETRSFDL